MSRSSFVVVGRLRPLLVLLGTATVTSLTACGGSDGGGNPGGGGGGGGGASGCGETARKQWVLDVARDWYLFPETLPGTVDLAAYATAEGLLDALTATARSQGKDRFFSYLTTRAAENSLFGEGEFVGFGFRNRTDAGNRPMILDVYENSPAAAAGLRRGDEIVAVDDGGGYVAVSQSLVNGRTISDLLGPADAGVTRGLRILRAGSTFDVSMTKRTVTLDPVPDTYGTTVLPLAGTTGVGYLHLRSYISTADPQLRTAFSTFRAQGLQYFVIDLRYNGGGLVSTSQLMNDLLGADRAASDVQFRMVHNAARSNQNATARFQPQAQSVGPVRIAFLTTEATASASEINVNTMKPYVETAIVGSNTLGKPVGQLAFDLQGCEDRLRLISFKTVNALDEGDYYDGLAGTMPFACAAPDTLGAPLGTAEDSLVDEALYWLTHGACRTVMSAGTGDDRLKPTFERATPYPRPQQPSDAEHWLPGVQ
jgi:carboxyl-terminal processing protease